jgi:hypothetical protein
LTVTPTGNPTGTTVIAGVGGLILGHAVWLIGISIALGSTSVSGGVLIIAAFFLLAAGGLLYLAWQQYQQKQLTPAAFLAGLAFSPVVFTLIVLGQTYL